MGLFTPRSYLEPEINTIMVFCSSHTSALCSPQPRVMVLNPLCSHRYLCSSYLCEWLMFSSHHGSWHPKAGCGRGSTTAVAISIKMVLYEAENLWREDKKNQSRKQKKITFTGEHKTKVKSRKPHDQRQLWVTFLAITTCKSSPPPAPVADCQEQVN